MSDQLRALGIDLMELVRVVALQPDMFVVGNVVSRARLARWRRNSLMGALVKPALHQRSQWLAEHVLQTAM
jgi:UDP-N-acetylmuramate: L-alanyl-gamma-D-glutamyl-meso-diaminopimelate ligase